MLCLGLFYANRDGENEDSPSSVEELGRYRSLASSAIVLADYTQPQAYTLQALLLYVGYETFADNEGQVRPWVSGGLIIRLTLRMGYHRDSSHYPTITPYEGEMRRRVWALLMQYNVLKSFQLGLPSMIHKHTDTRAPHNLMDQDFSIASKIFPAERPMDEITPVSYAIAKSRICTVFSAAAEISHRVVQPSYLEEAMDLDRCLKEAHAMVPGPLQMRSTDQSIIDPPALIINRLNLEFLYQKTRCILHRRYLSLAYGDPRFAYSRETCLDAATRTLSYHSMISNATSPGGQLQHVQWYQYSIQVHDLLLAAMVICLEITLVKKNSGRSVSTQGSIDKNKMIELLEASYNIWQTSPSHQTDSCRALGMMLAKVKEGQGLKPIGSPNPTNRGK